MTDQFFQLRRYVFRQFQGIGGSPLQKHGCPQKLQRLPVQLAQVGPVPGSLIDYFQSGGSVAGKQVFDQVQPTLAVAQTQQLLHLGQRHAIPKGNHQLLQQVLRVPQAACGIAGHQPHRIRGHRHTLPLGNLRQPIVDALGRDTAEVETLAAGYNGGQDSVGLGGAENENHVSRRLFQGFQKGVGSLIGEHVGFVNDINLAPALGGGKVNLVPNLTDVLNAPVAGRIHLYGIHKALFIGGAAHGAGIAGVAFLGVKAIDRLGDDPGGSGFSGAPGAAEQVGMGNPTLHYGLPQGASHVFLAYQVAEAARPPFPVIDLGGHSPSPRT